MSAVFNWCQDTGTATSGHGTTRSGFGADTHYPTDWSLKNADDCTQNGGTPYTAAPIFFGNNSYTAYLYGHLSGSFSSVSAGLFAHTAGVFGTGITIKGTVTSTYTTPATSANAALTTDMTSPIAISAGLAVEFSLTGPEGSHASSQAAACYTQYLPTQNQTTSSAAPGDITAATMMVQYTES